MMEIFWPFSGITCRSDVDDLLKKLESSEVWSLSEIIKIVRPPQEIIKCNIVYTSTSLDDFVGPSIPFDITQLELTRYTPNTYDGTNSCWCFQGTKHKSLKAWEDNISGEISKAAEREMIRGYGFGTYDRYGVLLLLSQLEIDLWNDFAPLWNLRRQQKDTIEHPAVKPHGNKTRNDLKVLAILEAANELLKGYDSDILLFKDGKANDSKVAKKLIEKWHDLRLLVTDLPKTPLGQKSLANMLGKKVFDIDKRRYIE